MDEFELAGFDEETCEQLRKISAESGIDPYTIISFVNYNRTDQYLSEMEQFTSAWYRFKKALWDEFKKSKIGKFMIWLADKLAAFLGKDKQSWNG